MLDSVLDLGLGEMQETGEFWTEQCRYLQGIHRDWGGSTGPSLELTT